MNERIPNATKVADLPHSVPLGEPFKKLFGPCRSTQHELIRRGEIKSALIGDRRGRRVIFTQSYLDYLSRQQAKEIAGEIGSRGPNPSLRDSEANLTNSTAARTGSPKSHVSFSS